MGKEVDPDLLLECGAWGQRGEMLRKVYQHSVIVKVNQTNQNVLHELFCCYYLNVCVFFFFYKGYTNQIIF